MLNFFSPENRLRTFFLMLVLLAAVILLGMQVNRRIILSHTVTQERIAEGWKNAGLELTLHTIQKQENLWRVARAYGVDIDSIVAANPGLEKLAATPGQTVRVPNRKGAVHVTEDREDLPAIAGLYQTDPSAIALMNNLEPGHILVPGLELFVTGAKPVRLSEEMKARYCLRGIFCSPLPGRITSGMGLRRHPVNGYRGRHTGVDLRAKNGTPIAAAAAGTVLQAGEGESLGRFVIIKHQDSYTTVYGHCSEVLTAPGKTVKKGQIIARSGSTGRTTGPHLHFEIRRNGVPQDPMKFLW
jgi:murein DD-endopeptidase MepM/ murein hydrolase activator NlpD